MKIYCVGPNEFADYEIAELDFENIQWIVYYYEYGSWEGWGEMISLLKNGELRHTSLSHCSCYGPLEERNGTNGNIITVEDFENEDVLSIDYNKEVRIKVLELLGN